MRNEYYCIFLTTVTSKMFVFDLSYISNSKKLENEVKVIEGRTMLPLREILEAVGYELTWDEATKTTTITDVNAYDALDAYDEAYKVNELEPYEVDTKNSVGTLTKEEKAYLENYYKVCEYAPDTEVDMEELSLTELKELINEYVKTLNDKLDEVPCPDSLEGFNKAVRADFRESFDFVISYKESMDLLEGETEEFYNSISFVLYLGTTVGLNAVDADTTFMLRDIMTERNIDVKAELGEDFMYLIGDYSYDEENSEEDEKSEEAAEETTEEVTEA